MGHQILEHDNIAWVQEPPWHKLGVGVPKHMTASEAIVLAKLDWPVKKHRLYFKHEGHMQLVEQNFALVREDIGLPLSIVGDNYVPVQNKQAFDFVDDILGDPNGPFIEVAGSLNNGRVVWILVNLNMVIGICNADYIKTYLLFVNRNTGKHATECFRTRVRVVCNNTLEIANASTDVKYRHRHIRQIQKEDASIVREMLNISLEETVSLTEIFGKFAETPASSDEVESFINDEVLPYPKPCTEIGTKRINSHRLDVKYLINNGCNNQVAKGTWWPVYNGIVEWADWVKPAPKGDSKKATSMGAEDARMHSIWFGPIAEFKQDVFRKVLAHV